MGYSSCVVVLGRDTVQARGSERRPSAAKRRGAVRPSPGKQRGPPVCADRPLCGARTRLSPAERKPPAAPRQTRRPASHRSSRAGRWEGARCPYHQASETGAAGTLGSRPPGSPSTAHSSSGHISTAGKARPLRHGKRHRDANREDCNRRGGLGPRGPAGVADAGPGARRSGRPAQGALPHLLPRRPIVAYRSYLAGPAARCSPGTPSCTTAATGPEAKGRAPPIYDSCLPRRRTLETWSAPLSFSPLLRICVLRPPRPPAGLGPPSPAQVRSLPASALDTPVPPIPPGVPKSLPCFNEIPKAPEEAHPVLLPSHLFG